MFHIKSIITLQCYLLQGTEYALKIAIFDTLQTIQIIKKWLYFKYYFINKLIIF